MLETNPRALPVQSADEEIGELHSERLFTSSERVSIVDVAVALAYTFPGINSPEAAIAFASGLLGQPLTVSNFATLPSAETVAQVASPSNRVTIEDVAVLLAYTFPGINTPEAASIFVRSLLGLPTFTAANVLFRPGTESPSPSPSSQLGVLPGTLDLGGAVPGLTTNPRTLVLESIGTAPLEVTAITITGDNAAEFAVTPAVPLTIQPGQAASLSLTCTPAIRGPRSATLRIETNVGTRTVSLSCSGLSAVNTASDDDPNGNNLETCTLREAIRAVNNTATNTFGGCQIAGGTIVFAAELRSATITIQNSPLPTIMQPVVIEGLGAENLTISGGGQFRVFDVAGNLGTVEFRNLTIAQGQTTTTGDDFDRSGGGIRAAQRTRIVLEDSILSGNVSSFSGGGIRAYTAVISNSTLDRNISGNGGGITANIAEITNSTLSRNSVSGLGGGLNTFSATVKGSTFFENFAATGGGVNAGADGAVATVINSTILGNTVSGSGGGINATTATVTNSSIDGNVARSGGGIRSQTVSIINSSILNNRALSSFAYGDGGGIRSFSTVVKNSLISGNFASQKGGGIWSSFPGSVKLSNSTVSGNSSDFQGGGIYSRQVTVNNSTIVLNKSREGGGVKVRYGSILMNNTIIIGNTSMDGNVDTNISGAAEGAHNLVGAGGTGGLRSGINGNIVLSDNNAATVIDINLQNNGGSTPTHALVFGSLAIDAGRNDLARDVDGTTLTTDQRGLPRFVGSSVDIGAVEQQ